MDITDPLTRRVHIKMSGCPNGCAQHHIAEHRVLRRVDQGRRAHDPGLRRAHRRQLRGRRGRLRHAPQGPPAGQARPRGRRALAAPVRGRARRRRGVQRLRRRASARKRFEDEVRDLALPVEFGLETMNTVHRLDEGRPVRGPARRGRVRGLSDSSTVTDVLAQAASATTGLVLLCSFQKEESVLVDELRPPSRPTLRIVTIDTGVLFPETLATWKALRGALRRADRRRGRAYRRPWTGPEQCCGAAKVAALERALAAPTRGSPASAASSRRRARTPSSSSSTRSARSWKYNPLVEWTEKDLWRRDPRARPALPPAARPGLRVDRLRAVHAARRRPRGPLGGHRQDWSAVCMSSTPSRCAPGIPPLRRRRRMGRTT